MLKNFRANVLKPKNFMYCYLAKVPAVEVIVNQVTQIQYVAVSHNPHIGSSLNKRVMVPQVRSTNEKTSLVTRSEDCFRFNTMINF